MNGFSIDSLFRALRQAQDIAGFSPAFIGFVNNAINTVKVYNISEVACHEQVNEGTEETRRTERSDIFNGEERGMGASLLSDPDFVWTLGTNPLRGFSSPLPSFLRKMAERGGFEPPVEFPLRRFSKPLP